MAVCRCDLGKATENGIQDRLLPETQCRLDNERLACTETHSMRPYLTSTSAFSDLIESGQAE